MFETLVTGVLTNVLGSYIDPRCFSPDKINVGVWSGYVVLRDLELKPEVIAHPALNLVRGVVGSIELKIPWNRLQSESVVLTIDDVYLLVRTEEDIEGVLLDMDEFTMKKQLLEELYLVARQTREAEDAQGGKDDGFTARLVNKIVDNIELHIRRIHVRLEDYTTGDHPFSLGLTVESVHAQSTNSNWQPSYVDSSKSNEPRIYKIVELNHLSFYLDPHCELLKKQRIDFEKCSLEEFCHSFNHSIPKRFDDRHFHVYPTHQRHHFILKPVDASARLIVNRDPFDTSIPKIEVDITVAEVALRLEESQYCDLLYLASAFQIPEHHKKYQRYRKYRPRTSVMESSAKEWWLYAIRAVVQDVREKRRCWSWKYMKERREDRKKYTFLWEKRMRQLDQGSSYTKTFSDSEDDEADNLNIEGGRSSTRSSARARTSSTQAKSAADIAALEAIERKRSIEDILFFRYIADNRSQDSNAGAITVHRDPQPPMPPFSDSDSVDTEVTESSLPAEIRYRTWGKWMFGWTSRLGAAPSSQADQEITSKRSFPEVELRELFKIVEYEPSKRAKKKAKPAAGIDNDFSTNEGVDDVETSDDTLISRVAISLGKGSITLLSDPTTNKMLMRDDPSYASKYTPTEFLLGSFTNLQVAAISRGSSTKVDVSLQSIEAFDESADSMAFSRLLTRKLDRPSVSVDDENGLVNPSRINGPVFLMSYETNPVGIGVDAVLYIHMEPLEIVFSPTARCWGRLSAFLSTPQTLGLWAELEVASFNDIVNLKARTEAKLKYVMANRVALSLDIRVQAPVIVVPESDHDVDCGRMIIDLGNINFRTDRLSKLDGETSVFSGSSSSIGGSVNSSSLVLHNLYGSPQLGSSTSFVKQLYEEAEKGEGAIRWKEEFYDKFTLSITNVHVLLVPSRNTSVQHMKTGTNLFVSAAMSSINSDWELVERFNISVTLRTSVLPLDATLTRLYIHTDLPAVTFNLSIEKYFLLARLAGKFQTDNTNSDHQVSSAAQTSSFLGSRFLDEDGRFVRERRQSFLSASALKRIIEDDATPMDDQNPTGLDQEDLSDAESDDTWFSITSGNVDQGPSSLDLSLKDLESFSLNGEAVPSLQMNSSLPVKPRKRPRVNPTMVSTAEILDRRLFVCTLTIPMIAIHLKKPQTASMPPSASFRYDPTMLPEEDILDNGTLLFKLEGFRVRVGKKTLSSKIDMWFRSVEVEDFIESNGRSSEFMLFSCPTISSPFDLQEPPRRGGMHAFSNIPRRRSRQRERVISFQRAESLDTSPTNLLELSVVTSCDRSTGAEVQRDSEVRFGSIHVVFDQSYVCSLLELFEDTSSKLSLVADAHQNTDEDVDEMFSDAIPPPLELTPSISQEYTLPVSLTESVLADLERARREFISEQFGPSVSNSLPTQSNQQAQHKASVATSTRILVHSVSICFGDRGSLVGSVAVLGSRIHLKSCDQDSAKSLSASIADVRMFDLTPPQDRNEPGGAERGKTYREVFGLERNASLIDQGDGLVSVSAQLIKSQINESGEETSANTKYHITVQIRQTSLQFNCSFFENIVSYIIHGSLSAHFSSRNNIRTSRRRKRTASFSLEAEMNLPHTKSSPLSKDAGGGLATPFFDAVERQQAAENSNQTENKSADENTSLNRSPHSTPAPEPTTSFQIMDNVAITVEVINPTLRIPCTNTVPSEGEPDGILINFGVITVSNSPTSTTASPRVSLDVSNSYISKLRDRARILEDISFSLNYTSENEVISSTSTDQNEEWPLHCINIQICPVVLNVSEQFLCLCVDVWNDAIEPTIQIATGAKQVPQFSEVESAYESITTTGDDDYLHLNRQSTQLQKLRPNRTTKISVILDELKIVLFDRATSELDTVLRSLIETSDQVQMRDSTLSYATPGSPRRRRHLPSFTQDEFNRNRESFHSSDTHAVAEIIFRYFRLDAKQHQSAVTRTSTCAAALTEFAVRGIVGDHLDMFCQVFGKVPSASGSAMPQLEVSLRSTRDHASLALKTDINILISSSRLCILPRSLLRLENYAVGVYVSLLNKLADRSPRRLGRDGSGRTKIQVGGKEASNGDSLYGSHDVPIVFAGSAIRSRKSSFAESILDGGRGARPRKSDTRVSASGTSQKSSEGYAQECIVRVHCNEFQLWLLASEKRFDPVGLCLSNYFHLTLEQVSDAEPKTTPRMTIHTQTGNIHVRLDSLSDTIDRFKPQGDVVAPFTVNVDLNMCDHSSVDSFQSAEVSAIATGSQNAMTLNPWRSIELDISIGLVPVRLSYRDLPQVMKINSFLASFLAAEERVRMPLLVLTQREDPFLDLAVFETESDTDEVVESSVTDMERRNAIKAKVAFEGVHFRLVNNFVSEDSPVVGCRLGPLRIDVEDAGHHQMIVSATCSIEAWYHNLRLVALEPLVEPWSFAIGCARDNSQSYRQDTLEEASSSQSTWRVSITSGESLQVNVTDAFVANIAAANRAWNWVSRSGGDPNERSEFSTYWIRNQTGMFLRYWGVSCQTKSLEPGAEEALTFDTLHTSDGQRHEFEETENARQLFISVEDQNDVSENCEPPVTRRWQSEFAIPVDQADSRLFALVDIENDRSAGRVRKCECVIDVLVERGCKVFVVRSTLVLENNTGSDLEIEFVPPLRRLTSPAFRSGTPPRAHLVPSWKSIVRANCVVPLPLSLVASPDGYLMVRPPEMKSSESGSSQLPRAYSKKRVHLPLFERSSELHAGGNQNDISNDIALCSLKFHRLYGDRPVRPFMMSATLSSARMALYHRRISFFAPLVIHNLTAVPLEFCLATPNDWTPATDGANNTSASVNLGWEDCQQRLRERGTINIADSLVWHLCDSETPLELRIRIGGFEWSEPLRILPDMDDHNRIRVPDLSSSAHLFVTAETQVMEGGCRELFLYVPYWIVNLTGLKLEYEHDDERAQYEHTSMLLAGQKRLDREELLQKEEQTQSARHAIHTHIVHQVANNLRMNDRSSTDLGRSTNPELQSEERQRRHPGLIPIMPPIKGLLDLLPKPAEDLRMLGQLEVLQACHSSSHPERGSIRLRVNESDRRLGSSSMGQEHKKWSDTIALDQAGTSGELEAIDFSVDRAYSIGFSISTAKGRYSRTKVIILAPRFIVVNALDFAVEVCHSSPHSSPGMDEQGGPGVVPAINPAVHLDAGGYSDFHWNLQKMKFKTIRCRVAEYGWSWSGAVPLSESGEFVVRMRNESTRASKMIRVILKLDTPCVSVYLREESSSAPPYRIENYSLETFRVHQHRVRRSEILLPHHSLEYAWDEPTQERILVVDMLPSAAGDNSRPLRIGAFALDKIQHFPDALSGTLGIEISADGPTRVLRFTDTRLRAAVGPDAAGAASSTDARTSVMVDSFPGRYLKYPSFELVISLQGVGVSIVDSSPRELVYVSFTGLTFETFVSTSQTEPGTATTASRMNKETLPTIVAMRFRIRDFQVDNQLPVTPYPVLLRFSNPAARARIIDGVNTSIPVVDLCVVKHDGYSGVNFIRHLNLRVLPLHIRVDGSLLYQLMPIFAQGKPISRDSNSGSVGNWDRVQGSRNNQALLEEYNSSLEIGVDILDAIREDCAVSVAASTSTDVGSNEVDLIRHASFSAAAGLGHHGKLVSKVEERKLYFEVFEIDGIRATVSFSFGADAGAMVDGLQTFAESRRGTGSGTVGPLRLIINAIGTSLTKIANAPFHLKPIEIRHSFIQPDALGSKIASHYQSEALRQAYVILGSVDVFGNPMVAWRNLKGGFQDFIYEPVHGISKSPTEFALGMGRGTYSLIRASVYTFLDFNSRILSASSLGLSEACLKLDEYTGYPATRNIYQGFAQGISGIVVSPIRAVEISGVRGMVPGIFAGVFGLVLKPLLGLSLATATTVTTLRDAIDPNTKALLMRARPPRHIDHRTRKLKVYSYVEALGEEMVGKLRGGRYRCDGYLGHVDLRQKCFIVTRRRVLFVDVKGTHKMDVEWELQSDEVVMVDWRENGEDSALMLYFIEDDYTPRRRAALFGKGMFLSKHEILLPEHKIMFVRAMLQQQDRTLYASSQSVSPTLAVGLGQRSMSVERQPIWQQRFPAEYPIFRLPALHPTRSLSNLQTTVNPASAATDRVNRRTSQNAHEEPGTELGTRTSKSEAETQEEVANLIDG